MTQATAQQPMPLTMAKANAVGRASTVMLTIHSRLTGITATFAHCQAPSDTCGAGSRTAATARAASTPSPAAITAAGIPTSLGCDARNDPARSRAFVLVHFGRRAGGAGDLEDPEVLAEDGHGHVEDRHVAHTALECPGVRVAVQHEVGMMLAQRRREPIR